MFDDFMLRAALAGIAVAIAAGPLGCFVVWRRMAFIGDATAHAGILGVALALALEINVTLGVLIVATSMAASVAALSGRTYSADTLLGVGAHSALAFGVIAVSVLGGPRIDLMAWLFGDLLAVGKGDLGLIWGGALLVLGLILWRWSALLTATLNPDLAAASGINPARERMVLILTLAVVVAVAIKIVGALLIAAVLIIPAAASRPFARSPEGMAALASMVGVTSVLSGLAGAWTWDAPAGPSVVAAAAVIFALSNLARAIFTR